MATKSSGTRYRVIRDVAIPGASPGEQGTIAVAGDVVVVDPETAALLIRDGMIREES